MRLPACFLLLLLLTACTPAQAAMTDPPPPPLSLVTVDPNASATPTPFQPASPSDTPLPSPTLVPPSETPPPTTDTPPATGRTQYTFYVNLDYAGRSLTADETIRYSNTTGQSLSEIVLAVEPNLSQGAFVLNALGQDNVTLTSYDLTGHRMSISLPQPLQPGSSTTLALNFTLNIPPKHYEKTFGYLGYQVNLSDWYPFIVPFVNGAWVLHDPWAFGEYLVYDSSDFEVNLKVNDPSVVVAASAPAEANGEWTRYRLYGARTFVLSASDRFQFVESAVGSAVIRVYYLDGYDGAAQGMLNAAVQAVALYAVKFAPYPYDSLSVVQADVPDGQEYDGLVFLSTKFFAEYGGSAKSNLISIGVHEIAHQWWFGLVGNDQAIEPWLDEAMATYSENIFYKFNHPTYGDWWWNFRVNYFGANGWVDSSVYQMANFQTYVSAVYMDGASFLRDLNVRMGDDDFYRFLKDYAATYSRSRVTTFDFFATLRKDTSADISDLIQTYFQGSY